MYDESSPRAHDADRVRDAQRARQVRGEPGRFVSVCFVTHNGYDQAVHCVGTANDISKVVSPPMRRYSVRIGGSALSLSTFHQIMFATFNVLAMNVAIRAVLSLFAETHDGLRDGLGQRCDAHCSYPRMLRVASYHPSFSFAWWLQPHGVSDEDLH